MKRYLSDDDPDDLNLRDLPVGTLVQTWFPGGTIVREVGEDGEVWSIYDSCLGGAERNIAFLGCFSPGTEVCIHDPDESDRLRAVIALGGQP